MKKAKSAEDEVKLSVEEVTQDNETAKTKTKADEDDIAKLATTYSLTEYSFPMLPAAESLHDLPTRIHKIFNFPIDPSLYTVIEEKLPLEKLGLRMTSKCLVLSTQHSNLKFADIILSVDGEEVDSRENFAKLYKTMRNHKTITTVRVLRLRYSLPFDPTRIPLGYEQLFGYTYLVVVLFRMPYLKMSLSIKSYMSKVFVAEAPLGTSSGLSLQQGDAIIDVERTAVSNVEDTKRLISESFEAKGIATLLVERPKDDSAFQFCRMVLNFKKTVPIDCGLTRDVRDICRKERRRIKYCHTSPLRSILKRDSAETALKRVQISKDALETHISAQANPRLLDRVPHKQTELMLSRITTKSETSSDSQQIRSPSGSIEEGRKPVKKRRKSADKG
ncbi:unnamed protein product [Bursaphelenchus xylophilus]|uniref:(pine wood nematode) hypothetical protein n=1 Tax=Bursaphelenchus xylophilus TaxID=6326 RepID=A0A1I7RKP1_BURXY|nr:unnamed protein product [Bursaphelenchus xylophilus]CAG9131189.1 unnamed protein product [Bursaphelenchus xylophilus]